MSRSPWWVLPLILFGAALIVRLAGMGWGLPTEQRHWSYHPDEPVIYLYSQEVEPTSLDFDPGFYNYGTLYLTLLRVAGDVAKTYGGGDALWQQMSAVHTAGRLIAALAGAGTSLILFLMLRKRFGDIPALAGGLLVAFAPGFVVHSRFQTVDVLATFLLAVSALYALELVPGALAPRDLAPKLALKLSILSGVFAGLSAGTKYTGILALATLVTAVAVSGRSDRFRLGAWGVACALAAFVVSTPGAVLNSAAFLRDFQYEMQHSSQGHGLVFAGLPSGFVWHVYNLLVGVGPILVALGVVGLVAAAVKRDRSAWCIGAFFLIYFILIGRAEVLFLRYTFPLLIGLAFGLAWAVSTSLSGGRWAKLVPGFAILGLGGIFGGGLASTAVYSSQMSGTDPRDEALRYLRDAKAKAVGVVQDPWFYSPPYYPEAGAPRMVPFERRLEAQTSAKDPEVVQIPPFQDPSQRYEWNADLLDLSPEYVVFSSFETEGLDRIRNRSDLDGELKLRRDRFVQFVDRLVRDYRLERRFGGMVSGGETRPSGIHDLDYIRPVIWVWKRKTK